jgi:hypothetical protein
MNALEIPENTSEEQERFYLSGMSASRTTQSAALCEAPPPRLIR